jgi:Tfp pilus assembly protein PilF
VTLLLLATLAAALAADAADPSPPPISTTNSLPNDPVEKAFQKLTADDDAAQAEVEKWLSENREAAAKGTAISEAQMKQRINARLDPIGTAYEDFLHEHPNHARAHLAYGTFLNDRQNEAGAQAQWEKVLELDPKNADAYNNLAGRYSESGPVKKAFEFYTRAIELKPSDAIYYHNFADTLCVLSKQAAKHYQLDEQQIYAKAARLYSNAASLDARNFTFASDAAQVYYSITPLPSRDALAAWTNALSVAHDEAEREEVYVHFARVQMLAGRLAEARAQLNLVTNAPSAELKANLLRAIQLREKEKDP